VIAEVVFLLLLLIFALKRGHHLKISPCKIGNSQGVTTRFFATSSRLLASLFLEEMKDK
jgi:hypothetical protein